MSRTSAPTHTPAPVPQVPHGRAPSHLLLVRGQHRGHPAALHRRGLVDLRDVREVLGEPLEHVEALVLVDDVAASELDPRLDLVPLLEELAGVLQLEVVVVVVGPRAEADLLELALAGLLSVLLVSSPLTTVVAIIGMTFVIAMTLFFARMARMAESDIRVFSL